MSQTEADCLYTVMCAGTDALGTVQEFSDLRGANSFQAVFGCVDGTHIAVQAPPTDAGSYYNSKGFHSIVLQVVCNANLEFIDSYVGWSGVANDAREWQHSSLDRALQHNADVIPVNTPLLADCTYPLATYLMTPYRNNGQLSSKQKVFNMKLSSKRVIVACKTQLSYWVPQPGSVSAVRGTDSFR